MSDASARVFDLDDYVSGAMSDDDAATFEEALFDAADERTLGALDHLFEILAEAAVHGGFDPGISRRDYDAFVAAGRRVALVDVGPFGLVDPSPVGDVELVVSRIALDVPGVEWVDAEVHLPGVGHVKTIRDVKVDTAEKAIFACCDVNLHNLAMAVPALTRLVAVRDGRREVIAEIDTTAQVPS